MRFSSFICLANRSFSTFLKFEVKLQTIKIIQRIIWFSQFIEITPTPINTKEW